MVIKQKPEIFFYANGSTVTYGNDWNTLKESLYIFEQITEGSKENKRPLGLILSIFVYFDQV